MIARLLLRLAIGVSALTLAAAILAILVHLGTGGIVSWDAHVGTWDVPVALPVALIGAFAYTRSLMALRRRAQP
ncbi:hypothetical protein [Verrucosispora sp. WMMC514]|uniref:hypothetical protein n=1 Tax=Verrucosispora sp. WMMC514 TaxID=3015156 RepID=UPI00248B12B8|nr:hypothetical protein [Verrucosispora sp. WMMC514]WBB94127.1 hypothetical protein O7597_14860 [Verrucosispora sp. WMMC514]